MSNDANNKFRNHDARTDGTSISILSIIYNTLKEIFVVIKKIP